MCVIRRIVIALFVSVTLSGCASVKDYFLERSTNLARELSDIGVYLMMEEEEIAYEEDKERYLEEIYNAQDELDEACAELQESTFKTFVEEALGWGLKIAIIFSHSTCKEKICEVQKRFPDYKGLCQSP